METKQIETKSAPIELEVNSAALKRLMEEVAADDKILCATHYNRTHNRHNR